MSEVESGALGGAAQGAAAGAMIGGPVGAVVGGIIGGIGGLLSGKKSKAARKAANKAKGIERKISYLDAAIQRRDLIRQGRLERAEAMAAITAEGEGGMQSSATRGAVSSYGSQMNFNLGYFDNRIKNYIEMQRYVDKAGKYAAQAGNISAIMQAGFSLAGTAAGMMSPGAPPRGYSGLSNSTLATTNSLSTRMPQNFSWIQAPNYNIGGP